MPNVIAWLQGKKTYIVALGAIITALGAYLNGSLSLTDFIFSAFGALGLTTVRAAIAKVPGTPLIAGLLVLSLGLTSCDTIKGFENTLSPAQKTAFSSVTSQLVTIGSNVINAATSIGIAKIESKIPVSDNPYLASAALGLRTLQGTKLVTQAQVQDVIATFGDPNEKDKFAALGDKIGKILTDYGAQPITNAALEASATALNQLNAEATKLQAQAAGGMP